MKALRRFAYAALTVAVTHLVFGAIVRISGSGMGCGENWPKCYGHWFPPMNRPDLVIEWTHRLLASLLILSILALTTAALLRRREPGVSGRGGVLRPVLGAVLVVLVTAGFGAVTVFLGNPTWATVVHWTLAMTLLAVLATAAIRAGALGGAAARAHDAVTGTARAAYLAAGMAFLTVVMGGLTAKFPSGSVACESFPDCGRNAGASDAAVTVQLTHRTIAILLVLYLLGLALAGRRRADAVVVKRAALVAAALGAAQIAIAAAMVLLHLPPQLRSLHEAVGVGIWLSTFTLAYLAHLAGGTATAGGAEGAALPPRAPTGEPLPATANARASTRGAFARTADAAPAGGGAQGTVASAPREANPDAALEAERAGPPPHDHVGTPFPTFVSGEVELVDVLGEDERGSLSADGVATAALIAAVERAHASNAARPPEPTPPHAAVAAELSLVEAAIAALDSEQPGAAFAPVAAPEADLPPAAAEPAAIEAAARDAADDITATLEAMHAAIDAEPEAPAVAAPPDAPSVSAEVAAGTAADGESAAAAGETADDAQKPHPHTMAVIVARGADL